MSSDDVLTAACAFPSTHWSAVTEAAGQAPDARQALGELLARYMPAMRTYLVLDRRMDRHRADDLLQGFVVDRMLERNLLAKADPTRGRFRTFLLACLNNHIAMQFRRDGAASRHPGPGKLLPLGEHRAPEELGDEAMRGDEVDALPVDFTVDAADVFDVAWARQVLGEALERMRRECDVALRPDLWALFHGRVVAPALNGARPLDYAELTRRFGFASPAEATNALATAKRMFLRMLRSVVAEYADAGEVDEELLRLKNFLARAGSGGPRHR